MTNHGYPDRCWFDPRLERRPSLCRGRVTGQDWRRPELQARYGDEFLPHLRRRMTP